MPRKKNIKRKAITVSWPLEEAAAKTSIRKRETERGILKLINSIDDIYSVQITVHEPHGVYAGDVLTGYARTITMDYYEDKEDKGGNNYE